MKYIIILFFTTYFISCSNDREDLIVPYLKTNPIDSNDITTRLLQDSVLADGKSFGEIKLKVSDSLFARYRDVSFQISPFGKFNNDSSTQKLVVDINGEARAFVKSDVAGIAYVKATINNLSRTAVVRFYRSNSDTLKLLMGSNNISADNYSYGEIIAVTRNLNQANRTIVFTADKGLFSNGSNSFPLQAGANDTTRAYLRYNKAEPVRVTATAGGSYSKEIFMQFITAYPNFLQVEPDSVVLSRTLTAKSKITSKLLCITGTASEGQIVFFYDSAATTPPLRSIGSFFNTIPSNSAGLATTEYRLIDTSYKGLVYIRGYVNTPSGKVYGQNVILIQ